MPVSTIKCYEKHLGNTRARYKQINIIISRVLILKNVIYSLLQVLPKCSDAPFMKTQSTKKRIQPENLTYGASWINK